jgi:VRR-NUC domain
MRLSTKEIGLVRACLDWLALHRVMAWRMNNTGVFDPVRKVFRSFRGLPGVSDILGVLPRSVRLDGGRVDTFGCFLAVEVKRPGERLRADQDAFLSGIRQRGGVGVCVHSLKELEEHLRPFLG